MENLTSTQAYVEASSTAGILSIPAVDVTMYILIAILIAIAITLSNKHIKSSKDRMQKSEELIESERELFERRISERTAAFVRSEEQRLVELERNAAFGELSKGLFHDLMNPLSSLTLYAEKMNSRPDISDTAKEMVKKMMETSKRLGSYMDSVRRNIGNEKTADIKESDLTYEVGIVRDLLGYKARMSGVEIVIDLKGRIVLPVHPVRLHQLLLNLVSNAIEACEELRKKLKGQKTDLPDSSRHEYLVTIYAERNSSETIISVSDTGIGITPDQLSSLFAESFTTKEKGTGIGLKTIKSVVEQDLGGTIEVESTVGKGTDFMIRIPQK